MKYLLSLLLALALLAGCTSQASPTAAGSPNTTADGTLPIRQPEAIEAIFQPIVEKNLFGSVAAFSGRLLKIERLSDNGYARGYKAEVRKLDIYGNVLAVHPVSVPDGYRITTLTGTEDGGFLFVLGFEDYQISPEHWASDDGFASHIVKCDKTGKQAFDTVLDGIEGSALRNCFEANNQFFFFGNIETPETNVGGIYSPTDVFALTLDQNGAVVKQRCIAGSDYDKLANAELSDGKFVLSISSQSDDGDFAGSNSGGFSANWVFTLDRELETVEKQLARGRDYFDQRLGFVDGVPVYPSSPLLTGFEAGTPSAVIDYGDYYLVISKRTTGEYEHTPIYVSAIWYYWETVYSVYDKRGRLLFQSAVDSSPNYSVSESEGGSE